MPTITKTVLVPYTTRQMFNLISDIENYAQYLPWCTKSEIRNRMDNQVTGAVYLEYLKVKLHFVTLNTNIAYSAIKMELVEGPFKHLTGMWNFMPLGDTGCKIEFNLEYKFANNVLEKIIGPMFNYISKNIVECFIQEAKKKYQ
ncbi:MAG: type II toxin-antitoxin system RatA family toxin [Burkholderiales bacterium]|nr:type II toxin-antitoxin system RatA family toxin [Burkholderiales bacterium]